MNTYIALFYKGGFEMTVQEATQVTVCLRGTPQSIFFKYRRGHNRGYIAIKEGVIQYVLTSDLAHRFTPVGEMTAAEQAETFANKQGWQIVTSREFDQLR